jgi:hypothetical protein
MPPEMRPVVSVAGDILRCTSDTYVSTPTPSSLLLLGRLVLRAACEASLSFGGVDAGELEPSAAVLAVGDA